MQQSTAATRNNTNAGMDTCAIRIQAIARGFLVREHHLVLTSSQRRRLRLRKVSDITMSTCGWGEDSCHSTGSAFTSDHRTLSLLSVSEHESMSFGTGSQQTHQTPTDRHKHEGDDEPARAPSRFPSQATTDDIGDGFAPYLRYNEKPCTVEEGDENDERDSPSGHVRQTVLGERAESQGADGPMQKPTRLPSVQSKDGSIVVTDPWEKPVRFVVGPSLNRSFEDDDDESFCLQSLPELVPQRSSVLSISSNSSNHDKDIDPSPAFSKSFNCLRQSELPMRRGRKGRMVPPKVDDSPLSMPTRKVSMDSDAGSIKSRSKQVSKIMAYKGHAEITA